jgi:hypothetical protein
MAVHPGFAKGGKSTGHAYVKSAARPSGTSAKQAPHSENQGPAKTDTAHTTITRSGDRPSEIDTRITVQPGRLGKSANPNTGHAHPAELPFARNPYHPRSLSAPPRAPYSPIRNAIGLPISPRGPVGPHDESHPNSLRASPSVVSPAVPNSTTGRLVGTGAAVPRSTPISASRGAISGTGLAPRHQGPSQIGRPKAVAGINGTTIKAVR